MTKTYKQQEKLNRYFKEAVIFGDYEKARELLKYGADINHNYDDQGFSARFIEHSILKRDINTVKFLINNKVDLRPFSIDCLIEKNDLTIFKAILANGCKDYNFNSNLICQYIFSTNIKLQKLEIVQYLCSKVIIKVDFKLIFPSILKTYNTKPEILDYLYNFNEKKN